MTNTQLKNAQKLNPAGIFRLAKYLRLKIDNMSIKQVTKLVIWRLSKFRFMFR
jgi:hypothetical protein